MIFVSCNLLQRKYQFPTIFVLGSFRTDVVAVRVLFAEVSQVANNARKSSLPVVSCGNFYH
jgi:hypothetical protein